LLFKNKKILIIGGTGSLGRALTKRLLKTDVLTIRIFSREEFKQVEMESEFSENRLRFLIGDIRDKERLSTAMQDIDIVIHTAALKHVPVAEYNPFEAVKTNVNGTQNVIDACLENNVKIALAVSTDKAVSPLNTYGATKLLMERLFVNANYYKGNKKIKFVCVRYGNVLGSRGSILPKMQKQILSGEKVTVTDLTMTRFNITMKQAVDLVLRSLKSSIGGEVFVPKLSAYTLKDLIDAVFELTNVKKNLEMISVRSGEKYHEALINTDEIRNTYETSKDYVLIDKNVPFVNFTNFPYLEKTKLKKQYSSDTSTKLTKDEIKNIIKQEDLLLKKK
jgi:UDP-N-acetylglucosamine 4,6-dehydratase/5-epimerase